MPPRDASVASKLARTDGCTFSTAPFGTAMRHGLRRTSAGSGGPFQSKPSPTDVGSPASRPAIAESTRPQSSAERAIGPSLSSVHDSAIAPRRDTRPYVGRRPVTPQNAAGVRIEPDVSEPIANGTRPAATAAPGPLELPPLQYFGFHGLRPGPLNAASAWL